jgi:hypothetical protein
VSTELQLPTFGRIVVFTVEGPTVQESDVGWGLHIGQVYSANSETMTTILIIIDW